ncbi:MAG: glycosyltransferase [Clostridia bacterium]|nr:glycosyltransferase [Clostridia bacterium]
MDKKINVGLFIDTFYPMVDGVIQVVDQYATRLNKFCNVTVFTTMPRKGKVDNIPHPYKVVKCKVMAVPGQDYDLALPKTDKAYKKALEEANLDIVHIHSPFSIGKSGVRYAKKHNIPVIATMHSQYKQDFIKATKMKWLANILTANLMKKFNACDRCFAVNQRIAEIYLQEYKAKELPGVLLNGTDFTPIENEAEAIKIVNKKFGLSEDVPVFLFVGRITVLKNILFIAEALKILKDKGHKFKMLYVGAGKDEDKLQEKVKQLGLQEDVILTGKIMDRQLLKAIYLRAKLFLFPSHYDANSLVQIEAASQKTPTVFLKGSATSASVTNDVNGFIAENTLEEFAEKISQVLNDDALYATVQENAVKDLYRSWDQCVEEAYKLYLQFIEEKKNNNKQK